MTLVLVLSSVVGLARDMEGSPTYVWYDNGSNAETENGHRDFVLVLVHVLLHTYYVASCAGIV